MTDKIKRKHFPKSSTYIRLLCDVTHITAHTDDINTALKNAVEKVAKFFDWQIGHVFWVEGVSGTKLISSKIWYVSDPERYSSFQDETVKV
ncbi:MAG TPA: hypothetical protein VK141_04740 [Nitrosomonas sp.]|nr:hypothetical protein [Nitrosomonas sp.]